ncbi:MAG: site-2 protease family protein [Nitrospirales bacterium]|nr:site-2 protease family protein [Nitrospirales bacterium]
MDHEPPIASGPSDDRQRPSPSLLGPDSSADLPSQEDSSAPPLIMPTSKKDILREQFLRNTHRETGNGEPFHPEPYDPPHDVEEAHPHTSSAFSTWGLPLLLFVLTIFTTLWAGAYQVNTKPVRGAWDFLVRYPGSLINGLPFAGTLLGILVTHELGHYVLSRIHRVPASLPLFIPGPPHFIGTFGAVIRMKSPIMNRRALFDIGVAGPIAGFIAAVFAIIIGLSYSHVVPKEHTFGLQLGEPLLLQFFAWFMFGPIPSTHDIVLHPIAFAAWFGFFVTAINLLPLGQLDGGHVVYAVLGRRQRSLAIAIIPILLYLGFTGWPGWILWVGLAGMVGIAHPPVSDPYTLLGKKRRWVAWAALVIFIVTFAPVPFSVN